MRRNRASRSLLFFSSVSFSSFQGALSLKKKIDRDVTGSSYRLGVEVRDNIGNTDGSYQGKASRLMQVTVTDINDNKPTFSQESYNITKQESLEAGQKLDEIAATDKDIGENANISYKLEAFPKGSSTALQLLKVSVVLVLKLKSENAMAFILYLVKIHHERSHIKYYTVPCTRR